jgi:hypothetical protein
MGEISGDHTVEVVTDAMLTKLISQGSILRNSNSAEKF